MEPIYYAQVTTENGNLNLRSGPGTNYPVIGQLKKGTIIGVCENFGDWSYIVDYEGVFGYVSNKYLTPVDKPDDDPVTNEYQVCITCSSKEEAERLVAILKTAKLMSD